MTPSLVSVRVSPTPNEPAYITVTPVWSGVDRPDCASYSVQKKLADRFVTAIKAGVVFADVGVHTDVNGKTFATYSCRVLMRHLNADLRKLGF